MNAPGESGQFSNHIAQGLNLPLIDRERFAELIGMPIGVVNSWIARGYIPVYEIGKYRLVNLALLQKMALDKAFRL